MKLLHFSRPGRYDESRQADWFGENEKGPGKPGPFSFLTRTCGCERCPLRIRYRLCHFCYPRLGVLGMVEAQPRPGRPSNVFQRPSKGRPDSTRIDRLYSPVAAVAGCAAAGTVAACIGADLAARLFATVFLTRAFFAVAFLGSGLRLFTRPNAFLMFRTLGSEIPTALATCDPVLPALTSFFTRARMALVILARLRVFGVAAAFLGLPTLRLARSMPPPTAALTALMNGSRSGKPYCLWRTANSWRSSVSTVLSRSASSARTASSCLILEVIIVANDYPAR